MNSADTIKSVIEAKACPIHDVYPVVDILNDEITAACCCEYFQKYCTIEIKYLQSKNQYKRPTGLSWVSGLVAKRTL
ncbi:MAG TPA: hypothetical protein VJ844_08170 [Mucilaginibacter sp.]|nr:hypothetical protein [Mucilaginibacter sp.]